MHFYRPLGQISALTFDLDDTLYDNRPVISRTTKEMMEFIQGYDHRLNDFTLSDFERYRQGLLQDDPEIYHDVTEWRRRSIELLMLDIGLTASQASEGALGAMTHFAQWRSRIDISQETHDTLAKLAKKWPLAVITNGNAEPHLFGLDQYFTFILRAGPDGRSKPFSDMYHLAAEKLNLPLEQILHVGDDLTTDVGGAITSGMQACWINLRNGDLMQIKDSRLLPHLEISQLASLSALI